MNLKISIRKPELFPFEGPELFNLAKYFACILNVR